MVKNLTVKAGDPGLISGLGRSPGEGNGNPFKYSCLENPMDRGAWWAAVHGAAKSQRQLSNSHSKPALVQLCWNQPYLLNVSDTQRPILGSECLLILFTFLLHSLLIVSFGIPSPTYKNRCYKMTLQDFPDGAVDKNSPANEGDMGLTPGLGRFHMPWGN